MVPSVALVLEPLDWFVGDTVGVIVDIVGEGGVTLGVVVITGEFEEVGVTLEVEAVD